MQSHVSLTRERQRVFGCRCTEKKLDRRAEGDMKMEREIDVPTSQGIPVAVKSWRQGANSPQSLQREHSPATP